MTRRFTAIEIDEIKEEDIQDLIWGLQEFSDLFTVKVYSEKDGEELTSYSSQQVMEAK